MTPVASRPLPPEWRALVEALREARADERAQCFGYDPDAVESERGPV